MKNSKTNLIMLATMLVMQTIAHADDEKRTWGQFLDQNKYKIAAGVVVAGLGTATILYSDEFMQFFNSMPPAEQEQVADGVKKSIDKDQQEIQEKIDAVEENNVTPEELEDIAQQEQQVEQKQAWYSAWWKHFTGQGTGYYSENPDDQSSDFEPSDEERAQYKKDLQYAADQIPFRKEKYDLDKRYENLQQRHALISDKLTPYNQKIRNLGIQLDENKITQEEFFNKKKELSAQRKNNPDAINEERYEQTPEYKKLMTETKQYNKDNNAFKSRTKAIIDQYNQDEIEPGFNTPISYLNPINYWRDYKERQEKSDQEAQIRENNRQLANAEIEQFRKNQEADMQQKIAAKEIELQKKVDDNL